jgi:LysM repeat protein
MANPFIEPRPLITEVERRRRERFQIGVYAVLATATVFLAGMLIQGCQNHQKAADDDSTRPSAETATNETASPTNAALAADPKPETNAAVPPAAAAVPGAPAPANSGAAATAEAAPNPPPPAAAAEPAPTAPRSGEKVYVVKKGDSLARIAKSHGTTVKALKAANGLKSDVILAGRKLKLPPTVKPAATTGES